MPLQALKQPPFKPPKDVTISWNTWKKGLNLLLRENEIDGSEMVQSTNLLLTGSGVPTKRWGSQDYFQAGATGYGRFVFATKDNEENIQVLAMTDWGILTKKNGASYTAITGTSWASGYNLEAAQLGNKVYLVSTAREMVRYDFTSLTNFPTLASPYGLAATNLSGASSEVSRGGATVSWRITATSTSGGETTASVAVSLPTMPTDLSKTTTRLTWTPLSGASTNIVGYQIYRGAPGDEVWIGGVDSTTTQFDDFGTASSDPFRTTPIANTTGGAKAKFILRFQDRLILAGIPGEPTKVLISGRYPQHERFDWFAGGGFVNIEPDSGESITGLATYYQSSTQQQTIIVFKERSVWEVTLTLQTFGNYVILNPQYRLLTASQGCSSHRSIVAMENDIAFSNDKGIYILRYEPQLTNVINANEISAKIRSFFEGLSDADKKNAAALYADKKYVLSFPISKQCIVFDRERLSFTGPWPMPYGIVQWVKYIDGEGMERWIGVDSNDQMVTEFSKTLPDDKGTAIATVFKSKKEDFGDWTIFKTLNEVYTLLRSVNGEINVNIYIEDRTGATIVAKTFSIESTGASGTSGIGTDLFGMFLFGLSNQSPTTQNSSEIQKKAFIYKTTRTFQLEIRTTGRTDNYELLGLKAIAIPQARGNSPSAWNV